MTDIQVIIPIIIISAVTLGLRALPFIVLKGKATPGWIVRLGRLLPYSVMGMLVVYCLKGISFSSAGGFLPELIAGAITAGSYVWKKNSLLSIISGTAVYMILVQSVF